MAETRLTNAVIPEVFTAYTAEQSIYKSRLFLSNVVQLNPALSGLLAGGGETFQLPFWKDVSGTSGDIPAEASAATVNNLVAAKQIFRKQVRNKVWGSNDLVAVFAGDDPIASLQNMVVDYWSQAFDQIAIKTAVGVIANNIAADSSDLVLDISGGTGAAAVFSSNAVIDAQAKLGENGTVGRGDLNSGDFVAIAVHPSVYALMRKQNAIDFIAIGDQTRPTAFYMGMQVLVDRNLPVDTGVYDSYLLKAGAFQYGLSTTGYLPTEIDRDATTGFGIDNLYTRRTFGIHPVGFAWQEDTVTGVSPSDAELATAANWDRVFAAENARMVMLRAKIA
jgi:hypothetical protein